MKYIVRNINEYTEVEINDFYSKLSQQDKSKIDKIINNTKKKQSIVGRMLLNELLNREYNINYFELELTINNNEKPYIKNKSIYFNISHSYNYVICVVNNKEIGVDIEKLRKINFQNIKYFATESEKRYIKNSYKRAFQIYTLKESYFKMLGDNLNNILDIEFIVKNNKVINNNSFNSILINDIKNYIISISYLL